MSGARYTGPDFAQVIEGAVHEFLPRAGEKIKLRIQGKLGTYQPGWDPLAQSTLARKARQRRGSRAAMRNKNQFFGPIFASDTPLMDTGEMAHSGEHHETGNETCVSFDFPIGQHEQDAKVADFNIASGQELPARPVMWPTVEELMDPLIADLETLVASRLG